uniref:Uncharacterized protein n=1 Tax=Populus trichocarpa TaxID=3694 RepID=A0A2K1YJJ0_POPTR
MATGGSFDGPAFKQIHPSIYNFCPSFLYQTQMFEAQFVNPTLNYIASVKILIRQHSISRPFQQLPTECQCGAQKKMTWIMNFLGSIGDLEIPSDVLSSLRQANGRASRSQIPERQAVDLRRHVLMRCSDSHFFAMFFL